MEEASEYYKGKNEGWIVSGKSIHILGTGITCEVSDGCEGQCEVRHQEEFGMTCLK